MENIHLNHLAIIVAALSNFLLGGLWYSPILFYKAWMRENNFTEEHLKKGNPVVIYGLTLVFALVMAYNLAFFLGDTKTDTAWGTTAGFLAGLWAMLSFFVVGLFERRSWSYLFINGGYLLLSFVLMGFIIGAWR